MTFIDVLDEIRRKAYSEQDKGNRFEQLMRSYLLTDPLYANILESVWLWSDFPFRNDFSGKDTGIDLVARTAITVLVRKGAPRAAEGKSGNAGNTRKSSPPGTPSPPSLPSTPRTPSTHQP